jgi:hypothetical protein
MSWALREAPIDNPTELLVLLVICDHAHDDGRGAYPSLATIARMSRLTRRGAQLALRRLERGGHISSTRRGGRATVYRVNLTCEPRSHANDVRPESRSPEPANHVRDTSEPRSPKPSRNHQGTVNTVTSDDTAVFDAWREKNDRPRTQFFKARRDLLAKRRREGFDQETLLAAAEGPQHSRWHCGENPDGKLYNDFKLIFGSAESVERFAGYTQAAGQQRQSDASWYARMGMGRPA